MELIGCKISTHGREVHCCDVCIHPGPIQIKELLHSRRRMSPVSPAVALGTDLGEAGALTWHPASGSRST